MFNGLPFAKNAENTTTKSTLATNVVATWIKSASGKPSIATMANGKYIGNI